MEKIKLTHGSFYYAGQYNNRKEAESHVKKIGKPKNKFKIITQEITQQRTLRQWFNGEKAKKRTFYILYVKD